MKGPIDNLIEAAEKVWQAFLDYGPVDDGRVEGDVFDEALTKLRTEQRTAKKQSDKKHKALIAIINQWIGNPEPIHPEVRKAIAAANKLLCEDET